MCHILLNRLVFFRIFVHLCLYLVDLSLDVVEGPLLRLLHLDHHLLDLLELLEGVGLHLLERLLLGDKHTEFVFVTVLARWHVGEEGVLYGSARLVARFLLETDTTFLTLSVACVKIIPMDVILALSCLLLLRRKLHVRHILRLLLLS